MFINPQRQFSWHFAPTHIAHDYFTLVFAQSMNQIQYLKSNYTAKIIRSVVNV